MESDAKFTVATWNILLDRTHGDAIPPQSERLDSIIDTLASFDGNLDAVVLQEVEESEIGQHGDIVTEKLGYGPARWQRHSRKNEYIGMFGNAVSELEFCDLTYNKQAVIAKLGDVAVAGVHLKKPKKPLDIAERMAQTRTLLERLEDSRQAVIMGDFNSSPLQLPRRLLIHHGYQSVFSLTRQPRPATVPTERYRHALSPMERRAVKLGGRLLAVDDIYVKNLEVLETGTLVGDSDHKLVYASLRSE